MDRTRRPLAPPGAWQACIGTPEFTPGEDVTVAVDVGGERSATAVVWINDRLQVGCAFYHGDGGLLEAVDHVRQLAGEYNVRKLAFDPWRFAQASQELERQGMTVVEFAQTDVRMCPASQRLRDAIVEQRLVLPADQGARAARRRRDHAPQPPRLAPGPPDPLDHDRRCRRPGARARTD